MPLALEPDVLHGGERYKTVLAVLCDHNFRHLNPLPRYFYTGIVTYSIRTNSRLPHFP